MTASNPNHLALVDVLDGEPYPSAHALLVEQLRAVRMRIEEASDQVAQWNRGELSSWSPELLALEARIERRSRRSADLPMARLCDRFSLSDGERRILWTLIAHELCPIARSRLRDLATEQELDVTTDVLRRVAHGILGGLHAFAELGPEAPLVRSGLVERSGREPAIAEQRATWKVARRVLALVHGELALDEALERFAVLETCETALDELVLPDGFADELATASARGDLVIVHGRVGSGRRSALLAVASQLGHRVVRIEGRELSRDRDVLRRELRLIARECRLLGLVPLLRDLDALTGTSEVGDRIDLVEVELPGLVLATSRAPIARQRWRRSPATLELSPPGGAALRTLWRRALPDAGTGDVDVLATLYPMTPALISTVARLAKVRCGGGAMSPAHIEDAMRSVLDDRLAGLATRVEVTHTWQDIVLADEQRTAIRDVIARIARRPTVYEEWGFAARLGRGLGISALFSGPPGTGKTMAAGLLAASVRLPLYQVDLSKIVSKWLGETEKNLAALFDAAEAGHAILLFDEADALFGKRTEVKSSNDRHANQETNYLLQRLESYGGICILTTNHENAIDEAFRRRITTHLRFPFPDEEERARIWRALMPPGAPVTGDIDFDALARTFVMTGGYIRNAVLRAAFLAADEKGPIDRSRLTRAAQLEYERLGKVFVSRL